MTKVKFKNISEFLTSWDREIFELNRLLKKMNKKQKREKLILQKNKSEIFRVHK